MEHIGPYQMFSPIHLAYLKRCDANGLEVVPADLDSIERNHPAAAEDPLFVEYRGRAAAGLGPAHLSGASSVGAATSLFRAGLSSAAH